MSNTWSIKHSEIDASVNFSKPFGSSIIECRFVQRDPTQIIVYVSSHAGCLQACRFCHLTATGQTDETPVGINEFVEQLRVVLSYWRTIQTGKETHINVNWMARGEPLMNPSIVENWDQLANALLEEITPTQLEPKFNISTIYPKGFSGSLTKSFAGPIKPVIYWSLYSLNNRFRKRWLPKAQEPEKIINDFKEFSNNGSLVVHQAFIKDQNDKLSDVQELIDFINKNLPNSKINTVRYNPYSNKYGLESDHLEQIQELFDNQFTNTQLVPRVGEDVSASCGQFLNYNG